MVWRLDLVIKLCLLCFGQAIGAFAETQTVI